MFFTEFFIFFAALNTILLLIFQSKGFDQSNNYQVNETLNDFNFSCGITNSHARIINGFSTKPHFWPWIVSLRTKNSFFNTFSSHFCAGTIIDHYTILTAAHCVKNLNAKKIVIIAGIYNLKDKIQRSNIFYVDNFEYHSLYNITQYDIALLKISKKLHFNENFRPICLPPEWINTKFLLNKTLTLIGWGSTDGYRESKSLANSLQQTSLKVVNGNYKCSEFVYYDTQKIICAIDEEEMRESNACYGDSGGPLMIQLADKWYIIGITSFIISDRNGHCNRLYPSYYTNVNSYIDWINQTAKIL